ncbi:RNA-binding domain-containing protein [Aspergillus heteromorphus CBS 117.55]|uniref:RNA-binding domain-containing protein n=1 Tax=Aspergillus heteromorphus CBS 117.55 TaxID=1448321 RepID=A0A317WT33_9EURO|nr:RNA-binding domain-containing protein [Aspergillus heteromorphus CBS 117.55]PWY88941.1 RNA-binding domain-containing protein [Aspergillus heteromorphus CBS 117.55]
MAPAKQKAQKMSLGNFLADENFGSWADEMEDMPMPAPSQMSFGGERRSAAPSSGFGGGSSYERGGYAVREPLPLPTEPPYTAHVGNLSFEATDADISELFVDCSVTNVRVVEDKLTKAPKGFGYVEFETVDGLKKALDLSGATLQGRSIRVSIAEPPKERDVKEFDWTRRGPLPDAPQRRVPDRSSFGRNLDNMSDAGSERGGSRRNFESDGKFRDFGNWERKGPLSPPPAPVREGGRPRSNEAPGFRRSSPGWGEGQGREGREGRDGRSQDGSRPPRREFQERAPTAAELDNAWRSKMRPDQAPKEPSNPTSPTAAAAAPATRPRLNLQKRTVAEGVASPTGAGESKASIFGGAKPIDTAAREKEVEERRQIAIREKKEADEKARAEKAEKAEKQRTKDQAKTEKSATPADANGKDTPETAQGAKNFEILRRADEDESAAAGEEKTEEAPAAAKAEAPAEAAPSKANGNWRSAPSEAAPAGGDDEGWSTVSSKPRNSRRGGRSFA